MASNDPIGEIPILITGDYSELQDAISQAVSTAQDGATQIADAFDLPTAGNELADAIQGVGSAAEEAAGRMSLFGTDATAALTDVNDQLSLFDVNGIEATSTAFGSLADNAIAAAPAIEQAAAAVNDAGENAKESEGGLAGMAEQLTAIGEALVITEGLTEFGEEALKAAGTVQSVTIGLTALTGSAEQADEIVEKVRDLAATEPFAFPEIAPTIQKMVALGVSTEEIPVVMQAAADASAATGNSFQQVANAIDRMSLSGTAGSRQLVQLGVSAQQLASSMGVASDQFAAAFKNLDQEQRLQVLTDAMTKFAGTAIAEAQGISGQWQIFQNQFEEVMVGVGNALAPVVGDLLNFGKTVLSAIQDAVSAFAELPKPIQDIVVAAGLLAAAAIPVTAGLAAIGLGISGLSELLPAVTALFGGLTAAEEEEAVAAHGVTAAAGEEAIALEAQGAAAAQAAGESGIGALTVAVGGLRGAFVALSAVAAGFSFGWLLGGAKDAAAQLQDMKGYADSLGVSLKGLSDASGNLNAGMNTLLGVLEKSGVDISSLSQQFQSGAINQQQYMLALLQTAKAHGVVSDSANQAANSEGSLGAGFQQVAAQAQKLQAAYQTALSTLKQVEIEFDNGTASSLELALAQKNLATAAAALSPKIKEQADSWDSVQATAAKLENTLATASDTFNKAFEALQNGTGTALQFAIAAENLDRATEAYDKALQATNADIGRFSDASSAVTQGMQAIYDKTAQASGALQTAIGVFNGIRAALIQGTASQADYNIAWDNLLKAFQAANPQMATAKQSIQDVGAAAMAAAQADTSWYGAHDNTVKVIAGGQTTFQNLVTSLQNINDGVGTTVTGLGKLADADRTLIGVVDDGSGVVQAAKQYIDALGLSAQTAADGGVADLGDAMEQAWDAATELAPAVNIVHTNVSNADLAMQDWGTTIVNLDGPTTNLTDLQANLAKAYDAVAQSASNAAQAETSAADAGSSGGGGDDKSKGGGYLEDTSSSFQQSELERLLGAEAGPFSGASGFNFSVGSYNPGPQAGMSNPTVFGEGGIVYDPTLGIIGESGPEAVVPLGRVSASLMQSTANAPAPAPLTEAGLASRELAQYGLSANDATAISPQPSGGLTVIPDAASSLGQTQTTLGNTTTSVNTSSITGTPPIYKAGTGVVGTPRTLVSTDGGQTWQDAGVGNFSGASSGPVDQLTLGGQSLTDGMQLTVDGITLLGNSASDLEAKLNALGGSIDSTTRAAALTSLGLGNAGASSNTLTSAYAPPPPPQLTPAQIQALNNLVSTIPGQGFTGGGQSNTLPNNINVTFPGATIYGSQGAAQVGTALVNALKQNSSILKF